MSRAVIHLGVRNHLIVNEKCRESVEETKRLFTEEVDRTPDAKIFTIPLGVNKTFLASYLLHDYIDGTMELLKGEQLEHI
jgi:hypothetical protein